MGVKLGSDIRNPLAITSATSDSIQEPTIRSMNTYRPRNHRYSSYNARSIQHS
ncbi:hypothetical protein HETIRDRAFT_316985 [Heterobasidion irregulare TC 32-1]|uniref:Uncharacterized protein n=1 Tax=Heterobasidion irregulare (strain TC 32-1) TaxID=747525 RepID=W4KA58_HETIT|nr:uncharacterized protein HETIRDRAFT_316985 [Heterobasidion irregulare TC 32-1]ETW81956.1 hypothetical protein HETIRDRAFT_316985 [Heterobasidion irregulare TC 32-1]